MVQIVLRYIYTNELKPETTIDDTASDTIQLLRCARLYALADKLLLPKLKEQILAEEPDLINDLDRRYGRPDAQSQEIDAIQLVFTFTPWIPRLHFERVEILRIWHELVGRQH